MTFIQAIIIAIVEGLTEFLPISSTAHIEIANAIMHIDAADSFTKMFDIVIQLAAILAVIVLYWKKFVNFKSWNFYLKLLIAVIPSLVAGLLLKKHIDAMLENITAIAIIMVAGGILLLFVDKFFKAAYIDREEEITNKQALKVGFFQIFSILFPGLSRSAATIIGGLSCGHTRRLAAEFSFFLAVPTMSAATVKEIYDTYKGTPEAFHSSNISMLLVGCLVSFIVSLAAIKFFITYLQKHGFRLFGIYRIIAGTLVLWFFWGK